MAGVHIRVAFLLIAVALRPLLNVPSLTSAKPLLQILAIKEVYTSGEPILVEEIIINPTDGPIRIAWPPVLRQFSWTREKHQDNKPMRKLENGNYEIPDDGEVMGMICFDAIWGPKNTLIELKSRECRKDTNDLSSIINLREPGEYRITLGYDFEDIVPPDRELINNLGILRPEDRPTYVGFISGEVRFKIVEQK